MSGPRRYLVSGAGLALVVLGAGMDLVPGATPGFGITQLLLCAGGAALGLLGVLLGAEGFRKAARAFVFTNTFLVLASLAFFALAVEVVFQVVERAGGRQESPYRIRDDARLRVRLEPRGPGIDQNGWRNPTVPSTAEIVAIGDSQTYGYGVEPGESWPAVLADRSGRTVYNMSLGDYGPVQYLVLHEESRALSPKVTLLGLYIGNDFWNAYKVAYEVEAHESLRADDTPPGIETDTVDERKKLFEQAYMDMLEFANPSVLDRLRPHLATVRFFRKRKTVGLSAEADALSGRQFAELYPAVAFHHPDVSPQTVFAVSGTLLNQDRREVRIREGLRITLRMLEQIDAGCREAGSRLLVLIIPTKEALYHRQLVDKNLDVPPLFRRAVEMERLNREELLAHGAAHGIETFDLLPALRDSLDGGLALFRYSVDSHYTPAGYARIAELVRQELEARGW